MKIDKNKAYTRAAVLSEQDDVWREIDQVNLMAENRRRKTIGNGTRDKLNMANNMMYKNIANENIPRKLLIELASLSSGKFRVEAKSKYESVVLPISSAGVSKKSEQPVLVQRAIKTENESSSSTNDTTKATTTTTTTNSSPLENYYVTLKCTIVDKNVALVPPIRIFIPYTYPESNPLVDCIQLDEFDDDMLPEYS